MGAEGPKKEEEKKKITRVKTKKVSSSVSKHSESPSKSEGIGMKKPEERKGKVMKKAHAKVEIEHFDDVTSLNDLRTTFINPLSAGDKQLIKKYDQALKMLPISPLMTLCPSCERKFNLDKKAPREIKVCGHIYCQECLSKDEEDFGFICIKCQESDVVTQVNKFETETTKKMGLIKKLSEYILEHVVDECKDCGTKNEKVGHKCWCFECNKMYCTACAMKKNHKGHMESTKVFGEIKDLLLTCLNNNIEKLDTEIYNQQQVNEKLIDGKNKLEKEKLGKFKDDLDKYYLSVKVWLQKQGKSMKSKVNSANQVTIKNLENKEAELMSTIRKLKEEREQLVTVVKPALFGNKTSIIPDSACISLRVDHLVDEWRSQYNKGKCVFGDTGFDSAETFSLQKSKKDEKKFLKSLVKIKIPENTSQKFKLPDELFENELIFGTVDPKLN